MSSIEPASRLHRIIKKLARFVEGASCNLSAEYVKLVGDERLLGAYRGDFHSEDIAFTERAFIFTDIDASVARQIAYTEVQTVKYPVPASDSIELVLQLTDASQVRIQVVGREGNFRDVFEVGRFFMRVAEDAGKGGALPS